MSIITICLFQWHIEQRKVSKDPVCLNAKEMCREDIADVFGAQVITDNCYCALIASNHMNMRLLIQKDFEFQIDKSAKQRKQANNRINVLFNLKTETSSWDAYSMLRINLFVCNKKNKDLVRWIKNTNRTLTRVESIINVGFELKTCKLIIPPVPMGAEPIEIKKYQNAVEFLLEKLAKDNNKV